MKVQWQVKWAKSVEAKIICGHDYTPDFPGVIQAVDEAGGASKICGTLWRLNSSVSGLDLGESG